MERESKLGREIEGENREKERGEREGGVSEGEREIERENREKERDR